MDQAHRGREAKALEYGADVDKFWGEQAKQGKCSPPETFFPEHGTGMWIVKGDRDTLQQIHDTEENKMLIFQGRASPSSGSPAPHRGCCTNPLHSDRLLSWGER